MMIRIAETDKEIQQCHALVQLLRPDIDSTRFLDRVRQQQRAGYQLVAVYDEDQPACVAGYRISENLAWGRFLYIDDFVTAADQRSKGYGAALLAWLKNEALGQRCSQMHCDSGLQRLDAHRFYEREGMLKTGYHFAECYSVS